MDKKEIAKKLKDEGMRCNCDLDNWLPEKITGHSYVCRIHKKAMEKNDGGRNSRVGK